MTLPAPLSEAPSKMLKELLEWDRETFVYLNNLGIAELDGFWSFVTNINTWIPLYVFFAFLFFYKRPLKEGVVKTLWVVILAVFIIIITDLTKNYVARLRPNNDAEINTLIRILKTPTDYSFFSGHAASSFAITLLVYLLLRKRFYWSLIFFVWPLLFASSRIFVGVHFPLDILVGTLVGISSALVFYALYKKLVKGLHLTDPT